MSLSRSFDSLTAFFENRLVMALMSITLIATAFAAGRSVFPAKLFGQQPDAPVIHASRNNLENWLGREGPIFIVGPDLFPHQCGKAKVQDIFAVGLTPYADPVCQTALAGGMVLRHHEADLRVPWALIPDSDRQELRKFGRDVMTHLRGSFSSALKSNFFEQEYRPLLADILRVALRRAWGAPASQLALARALRSVDKKLLDQVARGIIPIAIEKAENNFWQALKGYAGILVGERKKPEASALSRIMIDLLQDERVQSHLVETLPLLASSGETASFAAVLGAEMGIALLDDERLLPLLAKLMSDSRILSFDDASSGIGGKRITRDLPQRLMRLRHDRDHNPLVAYVVHTLLRARGGFVVLVLSPEQHDSLSRSELPVGIALKRNDS
jgi:hypothetical protein